MKIEKIGKGPILAKIGEHFVVEVKVKGGVKYALGAPRTRGGMHWIIEPQESKKQLWEKIQAVLS